MQLLKHIYRKSFIAVAFVVILKILLCSSASFAYSENHNEYLNLGSEYNQNAVRQNNTSEYIMLARAQESNPLSVISVPVPPPALIIFTSTGAFIVKWLRRRDMP